MARLSAYEQKRDFRKTPEPRGKARSSGADGLRFVVQKHDASSLHYDFRLELDGVLKSWAVPKGPSLDPSDRNLAVEVEDHPLAYAEFEGVIPEGEYGGGTVMLWDRGTWEPLDDPHEGLKKGRLNFELDGEKLTGRWSLIRMRSRGKGQGKSSSGGGGGSGGGRNNWLLIKGDDDAASRGKKHDLRKTQPLSVATGRSLEQIAADRDRTWSSSDDDDRKATKDKGKRKAGNSTGRPTAIDPAGFDGARKASLPKAPRPQLATLVDAAPEGDAWLHEIKFDGYRILIRIDGDEARALTRNGKDWSDRFAGVVTAAAGLDTDRAIIDGEVVVERSDGTSDFQALQNVLKNKQQNHVVFYAFDLLHLGGYDTTGCRQVDRKQMLEQLLAGRESHATLRYSDHVVGHGDDYFEQACRHHLEGIISKRVDAKYRPKRTRSWVKVKCSRRQEFVIIGWTPPGGSRKGFGSLLLGVHDPHGRLVYAGRVGTGFSDKLLGELHGRLTSIERKTSPLDDVPTGLPRGTHWVTPKLVAEVTFTEWTSDGRLRHPAFIGLRTDKSPDAVVREAPGPPADQHNNETSADTGKGSESGPSSKDANIDVSQYRLTNPDRVLYPEQNTTKRQLAEYYAVVHDRLLAHAGDRPLALVRCPSGRQKQCFFQKHMSDALPDAIKGVKVREKQGKASTHVYIDSVAALMGLVQIGTLEIHGWGCRVDRLDRPDRIVFDLDPAPEVDWPRIIEGARLVRDMLAEVELQSFVQTTGGKGLHVVAPIERRSSWDQVKSFAGAVARAIVRHDSSSYIATMSKAKRKGKVFIDYFRNNRGSTAIMPYSTRARENAPVATPLRWDELAPSLGPADYTVANLPQRLASLAADPWQGYNGLRQRLSRSAQSHFAVD